MPEDKPKRTGVSIDTETFIAEASKSLGWVTPGWLTKAIAEQVEAMREQQQRMLDDLMMRPNPNNPPSWMSLGSLRAGWEIWNGRLEGYRWGEQVPREHRTRVQNICDNLFPRYRGKKCTVEELERFLYELSRELQDWWYQEAEQRENRFLARQLAVPAYWGNEYQQNPRPYPELDVATGDDLENYRALAYGTFGVRFLSDEQADGLLALARGIFEPWIADMQSQIRFAQMDLGEKTCEDTSDGLDTAERYAQMDLEK